VVRCGKMRFEVGLGWVYMGGSRECFCEFLFLFHSVFIIGGVVALDIHSFLFSPSHSLPTL
jgi:hypothetical protein